MDDWKLKLRAPSLCDVAMQSVHRSASQSSYAPQCLVGLTDSEWQPSYVDDFAVVFVLLAYLLALTS